MVAIPLDAERVRVWLAIRVEELAERSPIPLMVLPSKEDVYRHVAQEILQQAEAAAAAGEELTVIVPLGPRAHYALLARMVNEAGLSVHDLDRPSEEIARRGGVATTYGRSRPTRSSRTHSARSAATSSASHRWRSR
jgi:hypothetical protein